MARQVVLILITELDPGGAERVVFDLATGIKAFSVVVAALDGRGEYAARMRARGIEVIDLRATGVGHLPWAVLRLRKLLRSGRFSLLNTHLYHAGIVGRLAAAGTNIPVIGTCHIVERRRCPWRFWSDRLTAALSRREICVSSAVRAFQRAHTGLPDDFYPVVDNGVDLTRFVPAGAEEKRRLRHSLGLPDNLFLAGFLGRFDRQKGVDLLLLALKQQSLAQRRDFHLAIAGYGTEEGALRTLADDVARSTGRVVRNAVNQPESSGAGGDADGRGGENVLAGEGGRPGIYFAGYQPEPANFLRCLDLCLIPSRWEGLPLVSIEAQACGVPVIASRVDSLPEVVQGGGLLCEAEDPADLAVAFAALLDSREGLARLAAGGVVNARRFDLQRVVQQYETIYRDTIEAR